MGLCIYANGKFLTDKSEAVTSIYDHGFLYGDGIFEGIRVYNGRIFRFEDHMKRLYDSAKSIALTIPMSFSELSEATIETVRRTGYREAYIRLVVSRGDGDLGLDPRKCPKPNIYIIADSIQLYPQNKYEVGLKVITCSTRRNSPDVICPQIKSLNYLNNILAKIEVNRAGADEGIMLNSRGYVCEATADNIFAIRNGLIFTPPTYVGVLLGITRQCVFDIAETLDIKTIERNIVMHDVYTADEVFLTGSAAELVPVVNADDRIIGDGKPGPIFKRLLAGFREMTKHRGTPVYD
ncbi:MAG: branched-chain-amino-acid transaminase [Candidatus Coatesbacteria bacterium]|nr:branched-chain-amino-acid transaminase [Candidatus Coatesbacteria bacterium]